MCRLFVLSPLFLCLFRKHARWSCVGVARWYRYTGRCTGHISSVSHHHVVSCHGTVETDSLRHYDGIPITLARYCSVSMRHGTSCCPRPVQTVGDLLCFCLSGCARKLDCNMQPRGLSELLVCVPQLLCLKIRACRCLLGTSVLRRCARMHPVARCSSHHHRRRFFETVGD